MRQKVFLLLTVLFSFSCSHDAFIENETIGNESINNEFSKKNIVD